MNHISNVKGPERDEIVKVWDGRIDLRIRIAGQGPAVIYFHPAGGLYWDRFLDRLAEDHTVYAPELPGTTPGNPYAIHKVDTYTDLILIYEEAIRKLGATGAVAIGQSMGGMIAFDLASFYPNLFSKLIGLAPAGLWRDDAPATGIADLYTASPEKVPGMLFKNAALPEAQAMFAMPDDPQKIPEHVGLAVWTLGCAAKFMWPFPDHGLRSRLHRISCPTLLLWGKDDRIMPVTYAEDFKAGVKNSSVKIYENCGHILQMEKLNDAVSDVKAFIA